MQVGGAARLREVDAFANSTLRLIARTTILSGECSLGLSAMSFLPRLRFGRAREAEALEHRVSTLQTALKKCAEVAGRWSQFRRGVTAGIAVLMLALGFALGVNREPIKQFAIGLAQATGLASPGAVDAYTAYQRGDYAAVLRLAGPLAAQGDARAESMLGLIYYRGHGVPEDHKEAAKWFRRAGDQGDAAAQFFLGLMFSEGTGVPQDYAEAAKWYLLAADQGDPQAQYNLGLSYAKGEAGPPDVVSAYMWLNLATAHFAAADTRLSTAIASRDLVARQMTRDQIAEAQKRAREWTRK
jgi:TPR repeat protein